MIADKAIDFRALHERSGVFVIPNPWDAGTAKMLELLGYEALATTSAGFAFSLGRPDAAGAVSREEALNHARTIVESTVLPVSADLENGFGDNPEDCAETIRLAALATADPRIGGAVKSDEPRFKTTDAFKDCEDCPEMVTVAQGEVLMGSNRNDIDSGIAAENEGPQHKATIRQPFAVGRFEVTRDQYAAFVKRSGYKGGERCVTFDERMRGELGV